MINIYFQLNETDFGGILSDTVMALVKADKLEMDDAAAMFSTIFDAIVPLFALISPPKMDMESMDMGVILQMVGNIDFASYIQAIMTEDPMTALIPLLTQDVDSIFALLGLNGQLEMRTKGYQDISAGFTGSVRTFNFTLRIKCLE